MPKLSGKLLWQTKGQEWCQLCTLQGLFFLKRLWGDSQVRLHILGVSHMSHTLALSMTKHKPDIILHLGICRSRGEGGEGFLHLLLKSGREIMLIFPYCRLTEIQFDFFFTECLVARPRCVWWWPDPSCCCPNTNLCAII